MKQAPEHLLKLIEPIVEGLGYVCWGVEFNAHPQHGLLRIYIDSENGILLDDCSKVSHQLSGMLDVEDPIAGNYELEVSSPGADRPFFKPAQFKSFVGSTLNVNLFLPIEKRRRIKGVLTEVGEDSIVLTEGEVSLHVPFKIISKVRLVPEYTFNKGVGSGK